jgi:ureidoglycolate lyase
MDRESCIVAAPLTAEAFAPFGHVLTPPADAGRSYYGDLIQNRRPEARLDLSFATVQPDSLPLKLRLFERHAYSSQAFIPLDVARYLVTVCPDNGRGQPAPSQAVSFIANAAQTVIYAPGTWHHPMVTLDRPGRFAVVMWAMGDAGDEELVPLDLPCKVVDPSGDLLTD